MRGLRWQVRVEAARQALALRIAPWLYVPNGDGKEHLDEALASLAEVAYGSRSAAWTSYRVLVKEALAESRRIGLRHGRETARPRGYW